MVLSVCVSFLFFGWGFTFIVIRFRANPLKNRFYFLRYPLVLGFLFWVRAMW
nr:hypothetical protein [Leptospira interrogans]